MSLKNTRETPLIECPVCRTTAVYTWQVQRTLVAVTHISRAGKPIKVDPTSEIDSIGGVVGMPATPDGRLPFQCVNGHQFLSLSAAPLPKLAASVPSDQVLFTFWDMFRYLQPCEDPAKCNRDCTYCVAKIVMDFYESALAAHDREDV